MTAKTDRAVWSTAFRFHQEALEKLNQMERKPFWDWMVSKMAETSNANGNTPLAMGLLLAVFNDLEAEALARDTEEKGA